MAVSSHDVFILSATRSAIGGFGGSLAAVPPIEVAAQVMTAALAQAGVAGAQVGHVVMGHVINTEPRDMYLSRVAAMQAGIPETTPALNVNRLCGSGAQAVVSAVQALMLGDCAVAVAGGAESMSRSPYILPAARFGQKMGDTRALDMMTGALTCPFGTGHMGVTAENVAAQHGISRAAQDAFALESQKRAARAIEAGLFAGQITPIKVETRKGVVEFAVDEHPKATSLDALSGLKPVFQKDGTVTAGNASGINDGAAALVLSRGVPAGAKARARVMGYAHAGVDPKIMGIGPVPAVEALCAKLGMKPADFDIVESNEAFAAQAIAVNRELGLDPARVNPNGGAIALGHPVGATGAMLVVKALHELERTGARTALITMCIGGGQGIALGIERV
ncbi:beta-ketothiolase BktB [Pseudorhodobacter sp. MZDSW-24AT]|uniref:beta-ketothiolase BktB n=1 Tax=Pseudorhodobacter sp. MZDSW-24AT TaxID=2052957 RepID=UPI000C1E424D|nr:beta-ketothiolase BktB [Pseudorhodobacter sp. MZDSW-24AT]PJF09719.1 acetyl-CoA C-acyltransferase [Pseudorhodobacter sp. MZDSW-24AT]